MADGPMTNAREAFVKVQRYLEINKRTGVSETSEEWLRTCGEMRKAFLGELRFRHVSLDDASFLLSSVDDSLFPPHMKHQLNADINLRRRECAEEAPAQYFADMPAMTNCTKMQACWNPERFLLEWQWAKIRNPDVRNDEVSRFLVGRMMHCGLKYPGNVYPSRGHVFRGNEERVNENEE